MKSILMLLAVCVIASPVFAQRTRVRAHHRSATVRHSGTKTTYVKSSNVKAHYRRR